MISDNEIDLTEHRDFGSARINFSEIVRNGVIYSNAHKVIERHLYKQVYGEIPWNVYPLERMFKYDGLVALGNKQERLQTIISHSWGTTENKTCDCCGKPFTKIPWIKDYGLCKECNEKENSHKEILWNL